MQDLHTITSVDRLCGAGRKDAQTAAGQAVSFARDGDSLDWKGIGAPEIYERVTRNVVPGSIVLFHNAAEHTPEALADIIEYLLAEGYEIVPVSELLLSGEYTIDHTGQMCSAENA